MSSTWGTLPPDADRCMAITRSGIRCQRRATDLCPQHDGEFMHLLHQYGPRGAAIRIYKGIAAFNEYRETTTQRIPA